ncbi:MAG: sirohydrochlorin cobaltochelatase, partial [Clostridium sp.]
MAKENLSAKLVTLEEEELLNNYLFEFKRNNIKKIIIVPFLMVLGYHFNEDINIRIVKKIKELGFEVKVSDKPLGYYRNIRQLFFK